MNEVDTLKETKKADVVEMKFRKDTLSGKRLGYLKIEFSHEKVDENETGEYHQVMWRGGADVACKIVPNL